MTIEYYKREVYGNTMYYVKDSKLAIIVQSLTGKKTIDKLDIDGFSQLGLTFVEVLR
jgi:hypothetical protein